MLPPPDLRCELKNQILQQTFLTALEDGDFRKSREVDADGDLCPHVQRQLLQDFVLPHNLLVDVKMLVPVVNALSKLLANVVATQVCFDLKGRNKSLSSTHLGKKCFQRELGQFCEKCQPHFRFLLTEFFSFSFFFLTY